METERYLFRDVGRRGKMGGLLTGAGMDESLVGCRGGGCGPGGSRTRVRTRKPYVFYMLISAFGFGATARPEPPTVALASLVFT